MDISKLIQALEIVEKGGVSTPTLVSQKAIGAPSSQLMYARGMFAYNTETDVISAMITDDMLEEWFGFTPSTRDLHSAKTLDWIGPTGTAENDPDFQRDNDCDDCPSIEWGKCELLYCFGEMCAESPVLKMTDVGLERWEGQPRYYVAGPNFNRTIQNDHDWLLSAAGIVLRQMLSRQIILGNMTTHAKDFNGLQVLINTPVTDYRTGVRCQAIEPTIYDWNNQAVGTNICDLIADIVRRIRRRAAYLGGVNSAAGDMVLVMTSTMRDALLAWASCGCGPCSGNGATVTIDALERHRERARLAGGLYGQGMMEVDGTPVPIITSDWIPETSSAPYFCSDIYVLTRRIGIGPVFYGEHQDFSATTRGIDVGQAVNGFVSDGGRFLNMYENKAECYKARIFNKARLVLLAPWLQGRITDVCAPFTLEPLKPNPADQYFFGGHPPTDQAQYFSDQWYSEC